MGGWLKVVWQRRFVCSITTTVFVGDPSQFLPIGLLNLKITGVYAIDYKNVLLHMTMSQFSLDSVLLDYMSALLLPWQLYPISPGMWNWIENHFSRPLDTALLAPYCSRAVDMGHKGSSVLKSGIQVITSDYVMVTIMVTGVTFNLFGNLIITVTVT